MRHLVDAVRDEVLPALVLDLAAFDANAATLAARVRPPVAIRLATKSLRCPSAMRRLLALPRHAGLMTFSPAETHWLASQGFDDLLLAYPVARRVEALLVARSGARVVVDCPSHAAVLGEVARERGITVGVCLDVDASWRPLGVHVGVRRSPVRTVDDARSLASVVASTPGLRLDGVVCYEAQVAGLRDHSPGGALTDPIRRWIKRRSVPHVADLRAAVVAALRSDGHGVALVNGGGTGSLASTSAEGVVTEVTAGSGWYAPHLFDGYAGLTLQPALFAALPVVRSSDPGFGTCAGGGYAASGEAGPSRSPVVAWPPGLAPVGAEGFGEVQTPLRGPGVPLPGGVVLARAAKAGEVAERFGELLVVHDGAVRERWPTYRGLGLHAG